MNVEVHKHQRLWYVVDQRFDTRESLAKMDQRWIETWRPCLRNTVTIIIWQLIWTTSSEHISIFELRIIEAAHEKRN